MKNTNWAFINTLLLLGIYVAGYIVYQKIQSLKNQANSVVQPAQNLLTDLTHLGL